MNNCNKS